MKGTPRLGRPATESTALPEVGLPHHGCMRGRPQQRGVCPGKTSAGEALCTMAAQASLSTRRRGAPGQGQRSGAPGCSPPRARRGSCPPGPVSADPPAAPGRPEAASHPRCPLGGGGRSGGLRRVGRSEEHGARPSSLRRGWGCRARSREPRRPPAERGARRPSTSSFKPKASGPWEASRGSSRRLPPPPGQGQVEAGGGHSPPAGSSCCVRAACTPGSRAPLACASGRGAGCGVKQGCPEAPRSPAQPWWSVSRRPRGGWLGRAWWVLGAAPPL